MGDGNEPDCESTVQKAGSEGVNRGGGTLTLLEAD